MLDQQLEAMLQQAQAAGLPDLCELPPQPCRELYRQICAAADVPPADVAVRDLLAAECGVPLRVYTPRSAGPHALVMYYHGGGYVLGDIAAYDNVCRRLCADSGAMVVSVDYRLAPEHPWPAAFDDAWAALQWVASNAQRIGGDASRLAVAGDSAGAILATAVARRARDEGSAAVASQALIYPPAAGGRGDFPSRQRHAAGPTLTLRTMEYFHRHAFGGAAHAPDEYAAPLHARDLAGLPPALLQVAGFDPLRDEALAYGDALRRAGNAVTVVEYHGLAHGFISMGGAIAAARLAQRQLADALRAALRIAD